MIKQKIWDFIKHYSFQLFMVALGIAVLCIVAGYPKVEAGYGAAFYPRIIAVMTLGLSAISIVSGIYKKARANDDEFNKSAALKIVFTTAALIALTLIMKYFHPLVGIFLFLFGYLKIIAGTSWKKTSVISALGTIGLYGVILALRIPL